MTTSLNLFSIDGELLGAFGQDERFKIGDLEFKGIVVEDGLLHFCNYITTSTRDQEYKQVVNKLNEEVSQRKRDVNLLDKDLGLLRKKMAKGKDSDKLTSEMKRLLNTKKQHTSRIDEIQYQALVPVTYKQIKKVHSVRIPMGVFTKLPWFPKLVMWCREIEEKTDNEIQTITEKMPFEVGSSGLNDKSVMYSGETNDTLVNNDEIQEGHLYAVGGYNNKTRSLSSVEKYDPELDKWNFIKAMDVRRHKHGLAALNGLLYAVGGTDERRRPNPTVERYDPEKDTWSTRAKIIGRKTEFGVTTLNGQIYLVGGTFTVAVSTVERYNSDANKWKKCKSMNFRRHQHGVAVVNGELFVIGGRGCGTIGTLASVERYDPDQDTWTEVASMNHRREGLGVAVLGGLLYVVGGYDGTSYLSTVELYNSSKNTWTDITSMNSKRAYLGVAAVGGQLYAVGGKDDLTDLASAERYDPEKKKWISIAPMASERFDFGLSAMGV